MAGARANTILGEQVINLLPRGVVAEIENVGSVITPTQEAELRLGGARRCISVTFMVLTETEEVCGGEVRVMGLAKREPHVLANIQNETGKVLTARLLCTRCGFVDFDQTEVVP